MKSLSKITSKLVGAKFKHCSPNMNEGMDCFRLCIEYLRMKGADIPEDTVYKDQPIFDYEAIYEKDDLKTMDLAVDYLSSITKEIEIGFELAGDLLVMKMKKRMDLPLQLAIDAGNGQVIIAIRDRDVRIISKNMFTIKKVLRWARK